MIRENNYDYHIRRKSRKRYRHQLKERTGEIIRLLKKHCSSGVKCILDIGTADCLMLCELQKEVQPDFIVGIDIDPVVDRESGMEFRIIKADCEQLPFEKKVFNIIIAAAVIEHLKHPETAIRECHRVLKENGFLVLTTPHPFFDRIAVLLGFESKADHMRNFTLKNLEELSRGLFGTLEKSRFLLFPIPFPGYRLIEKILRLASIESIFMNQSIILRKLESMYPDNILS